MATVFPNDEIKIEVTCPYCKGLYKDPLLLPCGHTFCTPCLQQLLQAHPTAIRCPCCSAVAIMKNGLSELLKNNALANIVNSLQRYQGSSHNVEDVQMQLRGARERLEQNLAAVAVKQNKLVETMHNIQNEGAAKKDEISMFIQRLCEELLQKKTDLLSQVDHCQTRAMAECRAQQENLESKMSKLLILSDKVGEFMRKSFAGNGFVVEKELDDFLRRLDVACQIEEERMQSLLTPAQLRLPCLDLTALMLTSEEGSGFFGSTQSVNVVPQNGKSVAPSGINLNENTFLRIHQHSKGSNQICSQANDNQHDPRVPMMFSQVTHSLGETSDTQRISLVQNYPRNTATTKDSIIIRNNISYTKAAGYASSIPKQTTTVATNYCSQGSSARLQVVSSTTIGPKHADGSSQLPVTKLLTTNGLPAILATSPELLRNPPQFYTCQGDLDSRQTSPCETDGKQVFVVHHIMKDDDFSLSPQLAKCNRPGSPEKSSPPVTTYLEDDSVYPRCYSPLVGKISSHESKGSVRYKCRRRCKYRSKAHKLQRPSSPTRESHSPNNETIWKYFYKPVSTSEVAPAQTRSFCSTTRPCVHGGFSFPYWTQTPQDLQGMLNASFRPFKITDTKVKHYNRFLLMEVTWTSCPGADHYHVVTQGPGVPKIIDRQVEREEICMMNIPGNSVIIHHALFGSLYSIFVLAIAVDCSVLAISDAVQVKTPRMVLFEDVQFDPCGTHPDIAVNDNMHGIFHRGSRINMMEWENYPLVKLPGAGACYPFLQPAVDFELAYWECKVVMTLAHRESDTLPERERFICNVGLCKENYIDIGASLCHNSKSQCCLLLRQGSDILMKFWDGWRNALIDPPVGSTITYVTQDMNYTERLGFFINLAKSYFVIVDTGNNNILQNFRLPAGTHHWLPIASLHKDANIEVTVTWTRAERLPDCLVSLLTRS